MTYFPGNQSMYAPDVIVDTGPANHTDVLQERLQVQFLLKRRPPIDPPGDHKGMPTLKQVFRFSVLLQQSFLHLEHWRFYNNSST